MKTLLDLAALFIGVLLAFIIQQALPPMAEMHGARILLVPMIFCYAAMALPFPAMLAAALSTGLLSDLMYLHVIGGKVEIPLGFSIVYYMVLGCVANGFQSSLKGRNPLPFVLLGGLGTSLYLFLQFAVITWQRGGFIWDNSITWRILAPGGMAALLAPLFYLTLSHIDRLLPDGSRKARAATR
jgi:hypothetical protein